MIFFESTVLLDKRCAGQRIYGVTFYYFFLFPNNNGISESDCVKSFSASKQEATHLLKTRTLHLYIGSLIAAFRYRLRFCILEACPLQFWHSQWVSWIFIIVFTYQRRNYIRKYFYVFCVCHEPWLVSTAYLCIRLMYSVSLLHYFFKCSILFSISNPYCSFPSTFWCLNSCKLIHWERSLISILFIRLCMAVRFP